MVCPYCGSSNIVVRDSRQHGYAGMGENIVYRMRMCKTCYERFQTVEKVFKKENAVKKKIKLIPVANGSDEKYEYALYVRKGG